MWGKKNKDFKKFSTNQRISGQIYVWVCNPTHLLSPKAIRKLAAFQINLPWQSSK